jgi:hypothetical protein
MKARLSLYVTAVVLLAVLVGVGCSKAPTDARQGKRYAFRPGGQRCPARCSRSLCV